jgi:hypothetical protein
MGQNAFQGGHGTTPHWEDEMFKVSTESGKVGKERLNL